MGLTVLNLAKRACWELNLQAPSALVAATSTGDIQIRALLIDVARELRNHRIWTQQKRQTTQSLTASRTKYYLPVDYYAALPGTQFDTDNDWRLIGPLTDSRFGDYTQGGITAPRLTYRIFGPDTNSAGAGGQMEVRPTPTGTEDLAYEYVTANLFTPPFWTASETGITTSKYRFANGNWYKCSAVTTGTCSTTAPSHLTGTAVDGGVTWQFLTTTYEEPIDDTDLCLFDDDLMISGLKARLQGADGKDASKYEADFNRRVETALARLRGSFVGRMDCPAGRYRGYVLPTGGWVL